MPTIEDDPDWTSAWDRVKILWSDFTVGFDCICGEPSLILSDGGDERTCDACGRVYWLGVQFKVKEPMVIH